MTTFIDTNVLVYLLEEDSEFHEWAKAAILSAREDGPIIACDIVYAELSVGLDGKAETDKAMLELAIDRLPFSNDVLFSAGRAYKEHLRRGGSKSNVLSDFLIGAQAEIEDAPLLTNNAKDYRSYFAKINCIEPKKGGVEAASK